MNEPMDLKREAIPEEVLREVNGGKWITSPCMPLCKSDAGTQVAISITHNLYNPPGELRLHRFNPEK